MRSNRVHCVAIPRSRLDRLESSDASIKKHGYQQWLMAKSMIKDLKALQGDIKQLKKSAAEGESTKTELERICEQRDKYEAELRVALEDKDRLSE